MASRIKPIKPLGLTERQSRVLDFLRAHIAKHGIAPSYAEIAKHLGYRSKAPVFDIIEALEERGHIIRAHDGQRARSIRLVDDKPSLIAGLPDDLRLDVATLALRTKLDPDHIIIEACRDGIELFFARLMAARKKVAA